MDDLNEKKEQSEEKEKKFEFAKSDKENMKLKLGTVGNFVLIAFIILIIGTGGLVYYLIHNEKEQMDEQYNNLVSNIPENIQEENVESIANIIDSAISGTNNQTSPTTTIDSSKKLMNESLIVLYNGLILDTSKMDEVQLQYIDSTSDESDKYVITYYSYENYSFKESKLGTLSAKVYDNLVKIDNVGKIAISEDYDAVPREVKVINSVPTVIADNNNLADYDTTKTLITDLDGNGTDEYVLILANKTTGFSKISMFDSKGAKVDDLASIEKSKWGKETNKEFYLSISNIEIIDIDNDGIMEIVLEIPHATDNSTVSLLKYNNGKLTGKTNIECSLLSE